MLTITEALAELKVIEKQIVKKRELVLTHLMRHEMVRDPLQKDGGSVPVIARERQSMNDLVERRVAIRRAIAAANAATTITVEGTTRSIADWLTWRRDEAPGQRSFLTTLRQNIDRTRQQAMQKGVAMAATAEAAKSGDMIVNIDEGELARAAEALEVTLERLDGQLSLKNATVTVEI